MQENAWHGHGFDPTHQPAVPASFSKNPLVDEASSAETSDALDRVDAEVESLVSHEAKPEGAEV